MTTISKVMPNAQNTEYAVLSLMLKHSNNITLLSDLTKEDFYDDRTAAIFESIRYLSLQNFKRVDVNTVTDYVNKISSKVIGQKAIQEIHDMAVHSDKLEEFKKVLKEKTGERKLLKSAEAIQLVSFDDTLTFDEKVAKSSTLLTNIQSTLEDKTKTYAEAKISVIEYIKHKKANPNDTLKFGYFPLDYITGGIPNDFIVIAAMSGLGKTAFITNVAEKISDSGHKVLVFSAEMNAEEVVMREIQRGTGLQVNNMRTGNISDNELRMIESFVPAKNIDINDASNMDVDRLCSIAKISVMKNKTKIIFIDYIQLLTTSKHRNDTNEQMKYIANQLKALSKDLGIPVVALAQFNKEAGKSLDRKPEIGNLRDSSQIAMNAGLIVFIHRADFFDKDIAKDKSHPQHGLVELIVAKNRYGIANTSAWVKWVANRAQFVDTTADFVVPDFDGAKKPLATGFKKKAQVAVVTNEDDETPNW